MNEFGLSVKDKIQQWIEEQKVIIVIATTTGFGVEPYLSLIKERKVKIIAVAASRIGNPRWKPFDEGIKTQIEQSGGTVIVEKSHWAIIRIINTTLAKLLIPIFIPNLRHWEEILEVGGRICLQITEIAMKEYLIKEGETIVAIAGKDTALALQVVSIKPIKIALLDIIVRKNISL